MNRRGLPCVRRHWLQATDRQVLPRRPAAARSGAGRHPSGAGGARHGALIDAETANRDRLEAGPHEWSIRLESQMRNVISAQNASATTNGAGPLEHPLRLPGKAAIDAEIGAPGRSPGQAAYRRRAARNGAQSAQALVQSGCASAKPPDSGSAVRFAAETAASHGPSDSTWRRTAARVDAERRPPPHRRKRRSSKPGCGKSLPRPNLARVFRPFGGPKRLRSRHRSRSLAVFQSGANTCWSTITN